MGIDEQRRKIEKEVAENFPELPADAQSDLVDEMLQVELDTEEVVKMALGIKSPMKE